MMAVLVVVVDEGTDGELELAWEKVVLEHDLVLQGLVPALDLALGLRVVRRAAYVSDALAVEPPREVACDVGGSVVAEQLWSGARPVRCRSPRLQGRGPACR